MENSNPITVLKTKIVQFKHDARGQIAMMLALLLIPLAAFIGGALDFSQKITYTNKLQATLDSVSLAVAKAIAKDSTVKDSDLKIIADSIYNLNHTKPNNVDIKPYTIVRTKTTLTVQQSASLNTAFMALVGTPKLPITVVSVIDIRRSDVEIALILDTTGSMKGTKLADLKSASKNLINTLITTKTGLDSMRIALVPWSTGVNVWNKRKKAIKNNKKGDHYCAGSRKTVSEASPITKKFPYSYGNDNIEHCSNREIMPLTKNKKKLLAEVDKWKDNWWTASDVGLTWGWGTLSPQWNNYWKTKNQAKAYNNEVKKYIVLMTDGVNTLSHIKGDVRSKALCKAIKEKNIHIYTIGFKLNEIKKNSDKKKAQQLLQECASTADMYINAASGAELDAAFKKIADEVGSFYISG